LVSYREEVSREREGGKGGGIEEREIEREKGIKVLKMNVFEYLSDL
jgi:hypothetical protein